MQTTGFDFSHRLGGGAPTVRRLPIKGMQALSGGDMLNLEGREADLAATLDAELLGIALPGKAQADATTYIDAIVDGDAVYSVYDPEIRRRGESLDVTGGTGAQGVVSGPNGEFIVIADSPSERSTLVRIKRGKHAVLGEPTDESEARARLSAAAARAVAGISRKYLGRGPDTIQVFLRREVLVVLMRDVMTAQERCLAAAGLGDTVREVRAALQGTMKPDLVQAIEELTGRKVLAFLSDSVIDPDVATQVFILDCPVVAGGAPGSMRARRAGKGRN